MRQINYKLFKSLTNDYKILFLEQHYGLFAIEKDKDDKYRMYQLQFPMEEFVLDKNDKEYIDGLYKDYEDAKKKFEAKLNIVIRHGIISKGREFFNSERNKDLEKIKDADPGFEARVKIIHSLLKKHRKNSKIRLSKEEKKLIDLEIDLALTQEKLFRAIVKSGFDIAGIFDPSPISDLVAATLEIQDGNYIDAGLSLLGVVPYIGDLASKTIKAGKATKKIKELNEKIKELKPKIEKMIEKNKIAKGLAHTGKILPVLNELENIKDYKNFMENLTGSFKDSVKNFAFSANDLIKDKLVNKLNYKAKSLLTDIRKGLKTN
ncbi:MAG: hypothetical protein F6K39_41210 [Okeania sp. SIO3B3]|nr:hypothetical protein [Okeania sp. SIO3B3]